MIAAIDFSLLDKNKSIEESKQFYLTFYHFAKYLLSDTCLIMLIILFQHDS